MSAVIRVLALRPVSSPGAPQERDQAAPAPRTGDPARARPGPSRSPGAAILDANGRGGRQPAKLQDGQRNTGNDSAPFDDEVPW
jgi:hypothetical protein